MADGLLKPEPTAVMFPCAVPSHVRTWFVPVSPTYSLHSWRGMELTVAVGEIDDETEGEGETQMLSDALVAAMPTTFPSVEQSVTGVQLAALNVLEKLTPATQGEHFVSSPALSQAFANDVPGPQTEQVAHCTSEKPELEQGTRTNWPAAQKEHALQPTAGELLELLQGVEINSPAVQFEHGAHVPGLPGAVFVPRLHGALR